MLRSDSGLKNPLMKIMWSKQTLLSTLKSSETKYRFNTGRYRRKEVAENRNRGNHPGFVRIALLDTRR
jgi:hypothetical protein